MKCREPQVSVIVPVYNAERCLADCLASITSQTYRNLEIVLVDDGSSDGSGALCDEWSSRDLRIRVIHKENGGVSSARNRGLEECSGDYIGFVDADDRIESTMYEKLVESIACSDMACCGYYNYPMDTLEVKIANGTRKIRPCSPEKAVFFIYERNGYFNSACNKLFRRSAIFKDGGFIRFNTGYYVGEDEVWLAEVMMGCRTVSFVPEALYHWWPQPGSATRAEALDEKKMTVLDTKKRAMELLPQDKKTQTLLKAVMFNDLHPYKAAAYFTGDRPKYRRISREIGPLMGYWLSSDRASRMNKLKVLLMEMEMRLHLPRGLVRMTSKIRRFGIKQK